jgi:FKBP-type peptidyl-prolyl cis-trans isomerase
MDRRVIGLLVAGGILVVVVAVILIGRSGGSSDNTTSVADVGTKPTVEVPKGPAPTHLVVKDLKTGDGAEAKSGDQVSVQYVGVLYDDGKQFDASWDRGQPFSFQLGSGQVIQGWDQGVAGMKVGGRRELIIPPNLGYGAQGQPPSIPANATLVFVIDLLSVG